MSRSMSFIRAASDQLSKSARTSDWVGTIASSRRNADEVTSGAAGGSFGMLAEAPCMNWRSDWLSKPHLFLHSSRDPPRDSVGIEHARISVAIRHVFGRLLRSCTRSECRGIGCIDI